MNDRQNTQITLRFEVKQDGTASWVLSVPNPLVENEGWAVKPTNVGPDVALTVARAIDSSLGLNASGQPGQMEQMVHAQHSRVTADLRATIARRKGLLKTIERDEQALALLVETFTFPADPHTEEPS